MAGPGAQAMKQLHGCVNLIPVLAKADSFTPDEKEAFKERVSGP